MQLRSGGIKASARAWRYLRRGNWRKRSKKKRCGKKSHENYRHRPSLIRFLHFLPAIYFLSSAVYALLSRSNFIINFIPLLQPFKCIHSIVKCHFITFHITDRWFFTVYFGHVLNVRHQLASQLPIMRWNTIKIIIWGCSMITHMTDVLMLYETCWGIVAIFQDNMSMPPDRRTFTHSLTHFLPSVTAGIFSTETHSTTTWPLSKRAFHM